MQPRLAGAVVATRVNRLGRVLALRPLREGEVARVVRDAIEDASDKLTTTIFERSVIDPKRFDTVMSSNLCESSRRFLISAIVVGVTGMPTLTPASRSTSSSGDT